MNISDLEINIVKLLETIQNDIYNKALNFRDNHITKVDDFKSFKKVIEEKGGFVSAHWDGKPETEQKIKELTKATIRCVPIDVVKEKGYCVYSGSPSNNRVLFAKAY